MAQTATCHVVIYGSYWYDNQRHTDPLHSDTIILDPTMAKTTEHVDFGIDLKLNNTHGMYTSMGVSVGVRANVPADDIEKVVDMYSPRVAAIIKKAFTQVGVDTKKVIPEVE